MSFMHADLDDAVGDLRLGGAGAEAEGRGHAGSTGACASVSCQSFQLMTHPAGGPVHSDAQHLVQHVRLGRRVRPRRRSRRSARAPSRRTGRPAARRSGSSARPCTMVKPRSAQRADRRGPAPARSPAPGPRRSRRAAAAWRRCAGCAPPPASAARRPTAACPGCARRSCRLGNIVVDLVDAHAAAGHRRRQHQVLLAGQAGEDAALLGAVADAQVGDAVRRQRDRLGAVDHDRAGAPADQAHDGLQRGGAAGAVAAQQRDHLAAVHREVDAVQDVRLAVPGVQVGQAQELDALMPWAPCSSASALPM